jgi:serine/threonine protein kinase
MVGLFLGLMMVSIVPILIASMTRTELIRRRPLIRRRALIRRHPPIHCRSIIHRRSQPIYEDIYPIFCREPIINIQKGLESLLKFHALGYVHCDLKWGNILGKRKGGTYEVVLSDIEGAKRLGSACDGDMIATWEYMPLSMVAGFMSMQGGVPADVVSAAPSVFDPDIDFWAFGVMILEHFCKTYTQNRFRVRDLGEPSRVRSFRER